MQVSRLSGGCEPIMRRAKVRKVHRRVDNGNISLHNLGGLERFQERVSATLFVSGQAEGFAVRRRREEGRQWRGDGVGEGRSLDSAGWAGTESAERGRPTWP